MIGSRPFPRRARELSLAVSLLVLGSSPLVSQGRVLLLERRFGPDSAGPAAVTLRRGMAYWVEVIGPGTPVFTPDRLRANPPIVVIRHDGVEVTPLESGPHVVAVDGLPPGAAATVRVYADSSLTAQMAARREPVLRTGGQIAGGLHTGYRIDPVGATDPRGGNDIEACLLIETGSRLATCIGGSRSSFPEGDYTASWAFIEERARVASARTLGGRRLDIGLLGRFSQGFNVGPRLRSPILLGIGLYLAQRLAPDRLRGWQILAAWQHQRVFAAPETEFRDSERLTLALVWLP
jgi:hypothetical protein